MSAEKKAQARAERDEKRQQEERKDRRSMAIYTLIAAVVVIAAIAAMFWRSGILQRNLTALNVNGVKYTSADLQYYYNSIYSEQAQYYLFDSSTSVKKQVYDEATGQSWYDHLMDLAVEQLTRNTALAEQAKSESYTLSADSQAAVDATLAQLDTAWINYNQPNRDAFIRASFGPYMTYDRLVNLVNLDYLASDYATAKIEEIQHSDAEYQAYYQEHADQMDTVTFSQVTFRCSLPTMDAEGNPIERTEEETKTALDELKPAQKALADEVKAKLESGAEMEALMEEYGDQPYSSSNGSRATSADLVYSTYRDWLIDSTRKPGDVTLIENESGSNYYYYVVRFEDRELDQEQTHDVRHLLVRAGSASTNNPTQAEYDEAEQKAQSLLDEWKAGDATEESFISLVSANSDDSGSAQSGGLISNITSTSNYVDAFRTWAVDPVRREGDTELVKTEYGWHIMYYVSTNDPIWKQNTATALQRQDYEQLADTASQGWTVSRGIGMNFIET